MEDLSGRVLGGHYRLGEEIGAGATGLVYRGRHTLLEQDFAVKVLNPDLSGDAELRERFLREARSLTRFTNANAVQVRHCGEDDGLLYIVMDLCGGETLDALVAREGPLDERRAVGIALQALAALGAAHDAGIVHRDVKPANIMVEDGAVKVLDFGLARILAADAVPRADLTVAGGLVGTVAYMSPEQLRAEAVDARSDLFSLGIVLREMVSGQRPFDGGSPATIMVHILEHDPQPLPGDVERSLSPELRAVLSRALQKDRARRFQTADDFAAALRGVTGERRAATPRDRRKTRVALGLFGLAALALLASYLVLARLKRGHWDELRAQARAAFLSSRFEDAIRHYSKIVQAGEATGADYLERGRARLELSRDEAAGDLARAADLLPNDVRVPTALGRLHRLRKRPEEAERALRRALQLDVKHAPARRERVWLAFSRQGVDLRRWVRQVEGELEQFRKHAGGPWADVFEARFLLMRSQLDPEANAAEMHYRAGLLARKGYDADPKLAEAAAHLASIAEHGVHELRAAGKDAEANERMRRSLSMWDEAVERARKHPEHDDQGSRLLSFRMSRIDTLYKLHRTDAGIEALDELVELNPTDPEMLKWCAAFYTLIGGQEEAERIHERLLGIASDDAEVHLYLATNIQLQGLAAERIGDRGKAVRLYRRAREIYARGRDIAPERKDHRNYYAETCVKLSRVVGDEAEQERLLEEAAELFAAGADLYRRAEYHLARGDARAALRDMRVAADNPASTPAMLERFVLSLRAVAEAEGESGSPEKARALLQEALGVCRTLLERNPKSNGPPSDLLGGHVRRVLARFAENDADRRRELEGALAAYRRVVPASPDRPDRRSAAHFAAAEVLRDLGRPGDAVEEARKAVAIREAEAAEGNWFRLEEDREKLAEFEQAARPK